MTAVIRTRKIFNNKLFNRKQLVRNLFISQSIDIIHPGRPNIPKEEVAKELAKKYRADERNVIVYGLETQFGGGRSTGFALVYDTQQYFYQSNI